MKVKKFDCFADYGIVSKKKKKDYILNTAQDTHVLK